MSRLTGRLALLAGMLAAALLGSCAPVIFGGATTTGVVVANSRTTGSFIEDQAIELKALSDLIDQIGDRARYKVVSINRTALVVGQAPDDDVRDEIIDIVERQDNVRKVIDYVTIGEALSFKAQAADAVITTRVKTAMLQVEKEDFSSLNVKVLTENSVVYLMGLVTKENAAVAVSLTRETQGVQQVVRAFEFVEEE